jgi:ubiquinone/menaquinone biosynthesis C-methylase UbiE
MNQLNFSEPSNWTLYMQQALRPIRKKYLYGSYVNRLPLKPHYKILEFGSGVGTMAELLAQKLYEGELTCVDISDRYLSKARKNLRDYPNTSFYLGRLLNFDIDNGEFDGINVHYVLHDIAKEKRQELVGEMYDLLRPGGKIFLREPLKENHGIPSSEIKKLFMDAGFYPLYEEERKLRIYGDTFTACYAKISNMRFFLS